MHRGDMLKMMRKQEKAALKQVADEHKQKAGAVISPYAADNPIPIIMYRDNLPLDMCVSNATCPPQVLMECLALKLLET